MRFASSTNLIITDEMRALAEKLAEQAIMYDKAHKKMRYVDDRKFYLGTSWPQSHQKTWEEQEAATTLYKEISKPLYAAAKEANPDLFPASETDLQQAALAERNLKKQLNEFVKNVAAEKGIRGSNFYFYVAPSAQI